MTELDLSWNQKLSLPAWLQQGLPKLKKLNLRGCPESFDFGALSTFLNGSVMSDLDLSSCYSLMTSPGVVSAFIRNTKTIKKLRLARNKEESNFLQNFDVFNYANRILGQPLFLNDNEYDNKDIKDTKKALNDVNMQQNSQFALAIIQTLLASTGASAFQAIE